jgi:hypothetical protein
MAAAKSHLFDVPLIYRENLAGLRTTEAIDKTFPRSCQHRAGKEQAAAGTALEAIPLAGSKLAPNIFFSEMNQPKTPCLADGVKHKAGILERPYYSGH